MYCPMRCGFARGIGYTASRIMRWIDKDVRDDAPLGLQWTRDFLARFDTSTIEWVRIDRGRGKYEGVYGRCWLPDNDRPTFRLSCQVPGPFPCDIVTRKPPVYQREDGTFPRAPRGCRRGVRCIDKRTGRQWYRVIGRTRVDTIDEGIVWIMAHEGFHFLRRTRQIGGRDNEIQADQFSDDQLQAFRGEHVQNARIEPVSIIRKVQLLMPWA